MLSEQILTAARIIANGGIVAYPTESCFGLGCDPRNTASIKRLLQIKKRSRDKGLILISDCFGRFLYFIDPVPEDKKNIMLASWPGPNTWLCPAKSSTSSWLTGRYTSIGIRVTDHPIAAKLCRAAGTALVSTSANVATRPAIKHAAKVKTVFGDTLDYVIEGPIGDRGSPSRIVDLLTGQIVRS